jgi:hypothetical protein
MTDDIYKGKDTTRRDVLLGLTGTVGVAFATGASPAAAQMAQGHREVRPGTPPLQGVRVIERSLLLSGRLAGLLMADQGAEVFVERGAGTTPGGLDDAFFDRGKVTVPHRSRARRIRSCCALWRRCQATRPMVICRTIARRTLSKLWLVSSPT